jgi:hypothetical protein
MIVALSMRSWSKRTLAVAMMLPFVVSDIDCSNMPRTWQCASVKLAAHTKAVSPADYVLLKI